MAKENAPAPNQEVDVTKNADQLMYSSKYQIEKKLESHEENLEKQPLRLRLFNVARRVLGGREAAAIPMEQIKNKVEETSVGKFEGGAAASDESQTASESSAEVPDSTTDAQEQAESFDLDDLLNLAENEGLVDSEDDPEQDLPLLFQMLAMEEDQLHEQDVAKLEKNLERRMQKVAQAFSDKADVLGTIAYFEQKANDKRIQLRKIGNKPTEKDTDVFDKTRTIIGNLEDELKELPNSDRDVFYALHAQELLEISRELRDNGGRIVETPYVKQAAKEIMVQLQQGNTVFLHGETGTGKTEIARLVAARFAREKAQELEGNQVEINANYDPEFVRGWPGMDQSELAGHMVLTSSEADQTITRFEKMDHDLKEALKEYKANHPDASAEEQSKNEKLVRERIVNETSSATISDFFVGPLYRAARDGKVLILDEANYIPGGVLASLNDIMTKKPGEEIRVQENSGSSVTVKEGFGIIMTGNLGDNYQSGRQKFDTAFTNRIVFQEYDYLPQATEGKFAGASETDHVVDSEQKQLFEIVLASNLDDEGGMMLPEGGLDKIWCLVQLAKLTQLASQGRINSTENSGHQFNTSNLLETVRTTTRLSNRNVQTIISSWLENNRTNTDGVLKELDSYIYDVLIAKAPTPREKTYLYQLANNCGFFASEGWEAKLDNEMWKNMADGIVSIKKRDYQEVPFTTRGEVEYISRDQVVEAVFGEAPAREEEEAEEEFDLEEKKSELEDWLKEKVKELEPLEKLVDLYCPNGGDNQEAEAS